MFSKVEAKLHPLRYIGFVSGDASVLLVLVLASQDAGVGCPDPKAPPSPPPDREWRWHFGVHWQEEPEAATKAQFRRRLFSNEHGRSGWRQLPLCGGQEGWPSPHRRNRRQLENGNPMLNYFSILCTYPRLISTRAYFLGNSANFFQLLVDFCHFVSCQIIDLTQPKCAFY